MAQHILLIKSTLFFFGSSLKKKLKDKMAEFQVGGQTHGSLDDIFPLPFVLMSSQIHS